MSQDYAGRFLIVGPPGTGKTTFLGKQVRSIVDRFFSGHYPWGSPVIVCSLTRAAAAEVVGRDLPLERSAIGTLHSFGYRLIGAPPMVGKSHIEAWNESQPWVLTGESYQSSDSNPEWEPTERPTHETPGDQLLTSVDLLRHRCVPQEFWSKDELEFFYAWTSFKQEHGVVDFTDMIEQALRVRSAAPGNPWVLLVDEAQDLSELEYRLVKMWGEYASAVMLVGDPWQSLYTWRGAHPELFRDPEVPPERRRVLSQSYRVPAKILAVSVGWVSQHLSDYQPIEYSPRTVDAKDWTDGVGEVDECESTLRSVVQALDEVEDFLARGLTCMFQASCSYMLTTIVRAMRDRGLPFANPWRRTRADWNPLGKRSGISITERALSFLSCRISRHDERRPWTILDFVLWAEVLRTKGAMRPGAKQVLKAFREDEARHGEYITHDDVMRVFTEEHDTFLSAAWGGSLKDRELIEWWASRLLAAPAKSAEYLTQVVLTRGVSSLAETPRLYVGTIHSFKGSEADVVYVFPDLSAAAYRQWIRGEGPERDEIVRLFYVAMTRAKRRLVICRPTSSKTSPLRREVMAIASGL